MRFLTALVAAAAVLPSGLVSAAPQEAAATGAVQIEAPEPADDVAIGGPELAEGLEIEAPELADDAEIPAAELEGDDAADTAELQAYESVVKADGYYGSTLRQMEQRYKRYVRRTLRRRGNRGTCNSRNVIVRKDWGRMRRRERKAYQDAVRCLYKKGPPLSPPSVVPGARNRLDDFVAAHLIESQDIHFNGYLYSWHRHFVHLYDQALRNECGYRGPSPYWDFTRHSRDPRKSPVFDGGRFSMGGNGKSIPHGATVLKAFTLDLPLPPGTGGGCVETGPFTDLVVNLGLDPTFVDAENQSTAAAVEAAVAADVSAPAVVPAGQAVEAPIPRNETGRNEGALEYNPRCLTRDINLGWSASSTRLDVEYLMQCPNVECLERRADSWDMPGAETGYGRFVRLGLPQVHPAGHFSIGGLQNDPFASPGDPVFFLLHTMIDRIWTMWQAQDPSVRNDQVGGTKTPMNTPPSDQVSKNDIISFPNIGSDIQLGDTLSALDGPYCYRYA